MNVAESMKPAVPELTALADGLRREGFTHALLLGMGGSSLAPEVFRTTFGVAPGALDLAVLDNTSPEAVRAAERTLDLPRTIFLVSTKSGTTTETLSFLEYFASRLKAAGIAEPGPHFIAITDPGTPLAALADARKFRKTFLNPSDIGGRYSALSYFGLVPAALLGIDVERVLAHATRMSGACRPGPRAADNPGLLLGAACGMAAQYGHDKLSLLTSPAVAPFGAWLEQLIAESTGKEGRGIVPVDGEPWADPKRYGPDRLFVAIALEGEHAEVEAQAARLAAAGHPVLHWRIPEREALGAEFFRWEMAVALMGSLLEVDPFDEPNVTESKNATSELLRQHASQGSFPALTELASSGGLSVQADGNSARTLRSVLTAQGFAPEEPCSWLAAHLSSLKEGDYLALCAYLHRTEGRQGRLQDLRARLGTVNPTTLGYGPRFLHSTGQLHKGGPNNGVFIQITVEDGPELAIPGSVFGFGLLRDAQALGDLTVLDRRERRALRVHLSRGPDSGLTALEAALVRAQSMIGAPPVPPRRDAL
jgi:glucose-6-phosphate isomerase